MRPLPPTPPAHPRPATDYEKSMLYLIYNTTREVLRDPLGCEVERKQLEYQMGVRGRACVRVVVRLWVPQ